ncbi:hypothetical protein [Streptomyces hygroscopicus]|uniref:hypothetical protein n=1 Tax=Streptomyces hygroscopicus TaxID=1912 RepID=UPI002240259F|nr:hypothetical protein [Streptomyces hygroscopicus]
MSTRGTAFAETMLGTLLLPGKTEPRRVRLDLTVRAEQVLAPHRTTNARVSGRVRIQGLADDPDATGEMEISPIARRRILYRVRFTAAGRRHLLMGWKSVSLRRPLTSMTVLPYGVYVDGQQVGHGTLRFPLASRLVPFLRSWRFPRQESPSAYAARWDGSPGRTEVWYTTLTDPVTGTGVWLHHELTAPTGGSPAYAHGWVAVFPPDGPVEHARFGPEPWSDPSQGFTAAGTEVRPDRLRGTAGEFRWDLEQDPLGQPLYTFPRWAWQRSVLPAAHMLPSSGSHFSGAVSHPGGRLSLHKAPGATARIYGHGNARRWAWLHADLGGGDVLEVVAAVATRPGLNRLPPLVFLRLRHRDRTWPRLGLRSAVGWAGAGRFRARIGLPVWSVTGRAGLRRIRVTVAQPEERTLTLDYADPDGSGPVCRNSESADAHIVLERWWGRWRPEARWTLEGTAHAEVGER